MTVRTKMVVLTAMLALTGVVAGCNSQAKGTSRALDRPLVHRDVPPVLANTVGAFGQINGLQPTYVSGYGLVVGLNGTGSGDAPLSVRAMLIDEMTLNGVGKRGTSLADVTPDRMIDDPNTAVVLVQALVPPAQPKGTRFDVRVSALPGSSVTSLEGGTLYTTELRRGTPIPSGPETFTVATARGPILINPLTEPVTGRDDIPNDGVVRTVGRVLSGGEMDSPFQATFRLDNPSHARARSITQAINARFPQIVDRGPVARGINEDSIALSVPAEYLTRTDEFFSLVTHTRVDQRFNEEWARRYVEAIEQEPYLADRVGWALEALGGTAISYVRRLYEFPEIGPRLEALRVGARLRDPLTREHLEALALEGPPNRRANAALLLGGLPYDRRIDVFLAKLVDSEDVSVRIAAYQALSERGDSRIFRAILPDRFQLDVIPSERPMVYFTQQGTPKIVVFGDLELVSGVFASGWDNRLMVDTTGERTGSDQARVFYQDPITGRTHNEIMSRSVRELILYMAHETTPEEPWPGMGLSYSKTVGALHELVQGRRDRRGLRRGERQAAAGLPAGGAGGGRSDASGTVGGRPHRLPRGGQGGRRNDGTEHRRRRSRRPPTRSRR